MAFSTSTVARWTILSSSVVTPSGLRRPSVLEVLLQRLAVVPPRLPVHARSRFPLEVEVGRPERFKVIDVVQERRELELPVPSCCLTYPLQRTGRAFPARCPGRVLLSRVPFGQTPSLHPLRGRVRVRSWCRRCSLG